MSRRVSERWARRISFWQKRLAPRLPDIQPDDLALILCSVLRPASVPRRYLLRRTGERGYVL